MNGNLSDRKEALVPEAAKSSNELAEERTDLAEMRTMMAADRSLMAWIRTALSMMSFGFTIYKVLEGFQQSGKTMPVNSPRNIGLFLTAMGTFAMVAGTVEYWETLKELRKVGHYRTWRSSFVMALLMSALGLVLFFSIITKLF